MMLQPTLSGASRLAPPRARADRAAAAIGMTPKSHAFVALLAAFRSTGGTATAEDLARVLSEHPCGGVVSLARCMASGEIFSFGWRGCEWIPMFQFELKNLSVNFRPYQVRRELPATLSG